MVAEQEAGVSNPSEVGQEVPVRPSHKHAGGEGLQLDGLDAQQEKIEHVGRECDEDNMRSSEVDFYIFLLSWFLSVVDIYNKLLDTILTYA